MANIFERPEGIKIASIFILTIVATSMISRVLRSTELRVRGVEADDAAIVFVQNAAKAGPIRIIANRPDKGDPSEYENKLKEARETHHLPNDDADLFLEVRPGDVSEFSEMLQVRGASVDGFRVLRCKSPAIPNAIAALLLYIRDTTGADPSCLLRMDRGQPPDLPAEVPGVRRGRHGAGHPRSSETGGTQPDAAAAHSRRLGKRGRVPFSRVRAEKGTRPLFALYAPACTG